MTKIIIKILVAPFVGVWMLTYSIIQWIAVLTLIPGSLLYVLGIFIKSPRGSSKVIKTWFKKNKLTE